MDQRTRGLVRQRAGAQCEYCLLTERQSPFARLQIEHIVPKKHGGGDDPSNLALACIACNLHKGANLTGLDPLTTLAVELFNPRTQRWQDHFAWNGCLVVGKTPTGRTTVRVLEMNAKDRLRARLASA